MTDVIISKVNDTYLKVSANPGIKIELSQTFTFRMPNYQFHPLVKQGKWDGNIRLLNAMSGHLYIGLLDKLIKEINSSGYRYEIEDSLKFNEEYSDDYVYKLAEEINIPEDFIVKDYQNLAVLESLRQGRSVIVSATGSGKSFIMYLLVRHHLKFGRRILIVVPTVDLVTQMDKEFTKYNRGIPLKTHMVMAGKEKADPSADIVITTWQSIQNLPEKYFKQYQVFFGDEVHKFNATAKKITGILEKATSIPYRYGTTGSLDDSKINSLTIEGLFGKIIVASRNKELIARKDLSNFEIKAVALKYPEDICKQFRRTKDQKVTYAQEMEWLTANPHRNNFLVNLTKSLEGNTLLMFRYVKHGDTLYQMLKDIDTHDVRLVHGKIHTDDRKETIESVSYDNNKPSIIVASSGTFSTGINIPELDNIIYAHPTKSKIINLQAIGRVLRKADGKGTATLYDVVDDLRYKKNMNFAYRHFMSRYGIYREEGFKLTLHQFKIKS